MFQRKPKNRGTEGNKKPKLICLSGFNALVFQKKCGLEELVKFSKNLTALGITFEIGVNNLLNEIYFTRRATGYPGPGIIPSPNRNFYLTTQIKF